MMCKSKIHRATITDANLHYPGSLTADPELLAAAADAQARRHTPTIVHVDAQNKIVKA